MTVAAVGAAEGAGAAAGAEGASAGAAGAGARGTSASASRGAARGGGGRRVPAVVPLKLGGGKGKGKGGSGGGRKNTRAVKWLVAEFLACMLIVALSPLTDRHKLDSPATSMKRMTALAGVFLVLAIISSGGRGAARAAAGFGGLVTMALALSDRDVFTVIAKRFGADTNAGTAGPDDEDVTTLNAQTPREIARAASILNTQGRGIGNLGGRGLLAGGADYT